MFHRPEWHERNQRYLATAMQWLRARLANAISVDAMDCDHSEPLDHDLAGMEQHPDPPALKLLSRMFGLTRFDEQVLLLCVAMELDTSIALACARAHGDPNRPFPTFSLALSILDEPAWDVVAPDRPLRYWRMIELDVNDPAPLITRRLRADERIVNFLKGLNHLDVRLSPYVTAIDLPACAASLPRSHCEAVDALEARVRSELTVASSQAFIIQLAGDDRPGKRTLAGELARRFGLQQFNLATRILPQQALELDHLARLWHRETCLAPACLYMAEHSDSTDPYGHRAVCRFLDASRSLGFVEVSEPLDFGELSITCQINKPTPEEQIEIWRESLGDSAPLHVVGQLAAQFHLSGQTIRKIARMGFESVDNNLSERLWNVCRTFTRPKLDALTQRIDVKATWDDIVLPDAQMGLLRQIASQVQHRRIVYDEWGFRSRMNRGLGISALFAGPSGTGKTMAAEVLANELQLDLYRVDLSAVVNKYIGETEKNLRRVFDAADECGAILFFDEADALFGKRTEVKDSHDRYANIEVNYLLQRMESYLGLAILATNMKGNLDKAFLRRLRFIVDMPLPSSGERKQIWQKAFPPTMPTVNLDYDALARLKLSGGNIHSIALNASFCAAANGSHQLSMSSIIDAVETECHKLEMPMQTIVSRSSTPT